MAVIKLQKLSLIKKSKIFFDTNIWMYLFCNIGNYNQKFINIYSRAFSDILKSDNEIVTDIIVISEFINTYLRISYDIYKKIKNNSELKFKKYRKTKDYKEALQEVNNIVKKQILNKSILYNCNYNKEKFNNILNKNATNIDFNDWHILNICKENSMYLLTNDFDFYNYSNKLNIICGYNKYQF